jgi:hypothetical protein
MSIFNNEDLIFSKNPDGEIMSSGYRVNSILLQKGIPIMKTVNKLQKGGEEDNIKDENIFSGFDNYVIPAGISYITEKKTSNELYSGGKYNSQHTMLPDDIYDKLFHLIEYDKKQKRKTRKHISELTNNKKSKKTRRNI